MRRIVTLTVVILSFMMMLAASGTAQDQGTKADDSQGKMADAKYERVQVTIIRSNKDDSTLTVRRQNVERKVHYDSSTKWTRMNKPAEMTDFKDGADVICLGTYDEKGELHATRID